MKSLRVMAASFLVALLGCSSVVAADLTKVRIGFAGLSVSGIPIYAAINNGFFKEEGIELDPIQFKGGAPAIQALVGGGVEFMLGGAEHVLRLRDQGIDLVAYLALTDTHSYALVGKSDLKANSIAELKGQKLGITSPASTTDSTLRWEINKLGLNPDRDFEILGVGQGAAMRSAIDTGQVAAGMVIFAETVDMMQQAGKYKIVRDYREMPYPGAVLVARRSWLQQNAATARAVARAILKGAALVRNDPAEAQKVVMSMFPNLGADFAAKMAAAAAPHISADGRLSREAVENMIGIMRITESDVKPLPYEQIQTDIYLPK